MATRLVLTIVWEQNRAPAISIVEPQKARLGDVLMALAAAQMALLSGWQQSDEEGVENEG